MNSWGIFEQEFDSMNFSIVLYFGLLLIYTFKVMVISGMVYLSFIPISLTHYLKLNKKNDVQNASEDEHEDIL